MSFVNEIYILGFTIAAKPGVMFAEISSKRLIIDFIWVVKSF